jgi:hypothetical protein
VGRVRELFLAATLVGIGLAGCSSIGLDSGGSSSGGSGFRERMSALFSSTSSDSEAQALAAVDPNQNCPVTDIRGGAATLRLAAQGREVTQENLRYQATIARLARECSVQGPTMTVRVGVQGRVVLGPAGGPGQLDIPLRYAVVQEGPNPKTILTKLNRFPVVIADGQTNVPFLQVEEDLTFPVTPQTNLENYVVYVGFDSAAMREQPAKKSGRSR